MAAAAKKTAEEIHRELQELQRQHREVPPPRPSTLSLSLRGHRGVSPDLFACPRVLLPSRKSASTYVTPKASDAASPPPAPAPAPEAPARSAALPDPPRSRWTSPSPSAGFFLPWLKWMALELMGMMRRRRGVRMDQMLLKVVRGGKPVMVGSGGMGASGYPGGSLIISCQSLSRGRLPRKRIRAW
ncbi:hypothetical protein CFC21_052624 [Triticum aestivum]|uniref:Uncharacterized protein n=2 Tax=Triticum aestivum TaxID=4565 RepID=A0A9R1GAH2_WHEAT|nr:hypothetical protein CFC21_052624 [Triticum aestivum]